MREELLALAERCEAASGADRELDIDLGMAIGKRMLFPNARKGVYRSYGDSDDLGPRYTASLDAAMTLVPEGWAVEGLTWWPASPEGASNATPAQSCARLVGTSLERMGRRMVWGHGGKDGRTDAQAATPALALCAAALRARAQQETANA